MLRTFKRASTAYRIAGDKPVLRIGSSKDALYIIGVEKMTDIELVTAPMTRGHSTIPGRYISGQILAGHLDRLGNGNHAGAARYRSDEVHAFDLKGLGHTFIKPEDRAAWEADRAATKAGASA